MPNQEWAWGLMHLLGSRQFVGGLPDTFFEHAGDPQIVTGISRESWRANKHYSSSLIWFIGMVTTSNGIFVILISGLIAGCVSGQFPDPVSLDPSSPLVFSEQLYKMGRLQESKEILTQAIQVDPGKADLWNARGYVQYQLNNNEAAIRRICGDENRQ